MSLSTLATGDLVLFTQRRRSAWWLLDKAIELFTRSPYVHVGMIVVDPPFGVPRGTYLWECGYERSVNPETGTSNLGVRLTTIDDAIGANGSDVFVRKCTLRIADEKLLKVHRDVFLKPYDVCITDWLLAALRVDTEPQIGWLAETTDWSVVRPCDLSSRSTFLHWDVEAAYERDAPYVVGGSSAPPPTGSAPPRAGVGGTVPPTVEGTEGTNGKRGTDGTGDERGTEEKKCTEGTEGAEGAEGAESDTESGIECGEAVEAVEVVRCDMLVARLRSIGIEPQRVSGTEVRVKYPRGAILVKCSASAFTATMTNNGPREPREPREPRAPRSFESQFALVRYVREVLDAHLMAVIS
jgi:hypothetical protein